MPEGKPDLTSTAASGSRPESDLTLRGFSSEPSADDVVGVQSKGDDCRTDAGAMAAPLNPSGLSADPFPVRRRSFANRSFGELTIDGIRHSCLTLTSTALGGGLLAVSYVMQQVGYGLGTIMLVIGATMAYLSTVALMRISTETGHVTYAGLFAHCAGPRAGPILDAMLFVYGCGSCVGYFVFLGDFIPDLIKLSSSAPAWLSSRWFAISAAGLVIMPLALQRELAALRHLTPVSIMALVYVAIVVLARCPHFYSEHTSGANHENVYGDLEAFTVDWGFFNAFSICVFAFNCHINVVPVAGRLIRPSKARIQKVAWWVNGLQLAFYTMIGVTGYVTWLKTTQQDILKSFDVKDPFMAVGRVLLSFTMIVAIPINMHPSVRSGLQIWDYFHPNSPILVPSPRPSPASSPQSSPGPANRHLMAGQASPEASPEIQPPSFNPGSNTPGSFPGNEPALPRIAVTVACLVVEVLVAIAVPGVADVISLLGATVATAMMLVIPAYAMQKVLPHSAINRCQQVVLLSFACISVASVPIKILQAATVVPTS